jgi:hypothetical protein
VEFGEFGDHVQVTLECQRYVLLENRRREVSDQRRPHQDCIDENLKIMKLLIYIILLFFF